MKTHKNSANLNNRSLASSLRILNKQPGPKLQASLES